MIGVLLAWAEQLPTEPIQRDCEQVRNQVSPVMLQRTVNTSPSRLIVPPAGGAGFAQPTTAQNKATILRHVIHVCYRL